MKAGYNYCDVFWDQNIIIHEEKKASISIKCRHLTISNFSTHFKQMLLALYNTRI